MTFAVLTVEQHARKICGKFWREKSADKNNFSLRFHSVFAVLWSARTSSNFYLQTEKIPVESILRKFAPE